MFPVVDWQATYYHNLIADGLTTHQFVQRGYVERWNPLAKPFVDGGRWLEVAGLGALEVWAVESLPARHRQGAYRLLGIVHGLAAINNGRFGGTVIPVVVVRF